MSGARRRDAALTWEVPPEVEEAILADNVEAGAQGLPSAGDPGRAAFGQAAERHLLAVVQQLLAAEGVRGDAGWAPVVVQLAQTAAAWLSPSAMSAHGTIDPRYYVKVKRLVGCGSPGESSVVEGVAFRKNVAHKRMRTQVPRARVMLLTGELSWRPSGASAASKISSFDTLIDTEQEQLAAAVERIASFDPDVLLVERSVPRAAQELLLERGIALAINVKREVLHRVAWCTGAEVAPSLEGLNGRCVGFCKEFEVANLAGLQAAGAAEQAQPQAVNAAAPEQHEARAASDGGALQKASGPKSIMLFKGCPRQLGCSILLRGMDVAELSAVKRVAAFAAYVAYWNRLEVSFLADQVLAASMAVGPGQANHALAAAAAELAAAESELAASAERGPQPIVSASPHVTYRQERGSEGMESSGAAGDAALIAALQPAASGPEVGGAAAEAAGSNPVPSSGAPAEVPLPSNGLLAHPVETASSSSSSSDLWPRPMSPQDPLSRAVRDIALQTAAADEDNGVSSEGDVSSDDEAGPGGADAAAAEPARSAGKGAAPAATPGTALYGTQQLWLSISCKNPGKGTLCEPPHPHCMKFYADTDLPLARFLAAAAPANRRCQHPQCGDGAQLHLRSFAHGDGIVTLSSMRFPAGKELPHGDKGRVWLWARPVNAGADAGSGVRRLALSQDAACLSFAHLLDLLLNARHLTLPGGGSLQRDFVRYIGTGSSVLCLHFSSAVPYDVVMPSGQVALTCGPEAAWLHEEIKQLTEEADEAFTSIAFALSEQLESLSDDDGNRQAWVETLAESRASYMDMVQSAVSLMEGELAGKESSVPAPDAAVRAVWELNRLRRMLALMVLEWASSLHEGLPKASAKQSSTAQASPVASPPQPPEGRGLEQPDGAVATARQLDLGQSAGNGSTARKQAEAVPVASGRRWVQNDYSAPSLQEASTSPGCGSAQPALDPVIPTGLVSRYISQYEAARDGLGRTSPQQLRERMGEQEILGAGLEALPRPSFTIDLTDPDLDLAGALSPGGGEQGRPAYAEEDKLQQLAEKLRHMSLSRNASQQQEHASPQEAAGDADAVAAVAPQPPAPASTKEPGSSSAAAEALDLPSRLQQLLSHSRSNSRGADALLGHVHLTGAGRVELSGRALLPPGADGMHITVFDDEPTSVIAYCLASREYQRYMRDAVASILFGGKVSPVGPLPPEGTPEKLGTALSWAPEEAAPVPAGEGAAATPPSAPDAPAAAGGGKQGRGDDLRVLFSEAQMDCQLSVEDGVPGTPWGVARFQVTAHFAPQFAELRRRCMAGGEPAFLASLSRCRKWASQGGKSNVYFAKTRDDRFIVKQLTRSERASFLAFAPDYFRHLAALLHRGRDTCLAKVLGVFQVTLTQGGGGGGGRGGGGGGGEVCMDLLIQENIFYGRPQLHRIYDLKGSERDRYAADNPAAPGSVLMDDNLREANLAMPTLVGPAAAAALQRAVWADTGFLAGLGVMDYSLLVGVDRGGRELVVGLIDYVRQYTWDKQVETWVKKTGILGGAGKDPTVISPRQYSRRFRAAMASYFTVSPSLEAPAPALDPDAV